MMLLPPARQAHPSLPWILWVALLLPLWGAACGSENAGQSFAAESQPDPLRPEILLPLLEQHLQAKTQGADPEKVLADLRDQKALHHPDLLATALASAPDKRLFVQGGALSPLGERLLARLRASRAEGLDPADLHLAALEQLGEDAKVREQRLQAHTAKLPTPTVSERERLLRALTPAQPAPSAQGAAPPAAPAPPNPQEALASALLDPQFGVEPGGLAEWYQAYLQSAQQRSDHEPKLDLLLSDALLRYAWQVRYKNPANYPGGVHKGKTDPKVAKRELARADEIAKEREALGHKAMLDWLGRLRQAPDQDGALAILEALQPPMGQHAKLTEALTRYEALAAEGGWPTEFPLLAAGTRLEPVRFTRDAPPEPGLIPLVKKRLAAERFLQGPTDDETWSDAFDKALQDYAHTHQVDADPIAIHYEMIETMRVPVNYRVAQIKTTLARWRETRTLADDYYIFVNLPDFHAEIWEKGERKMRFRVVVGNTDVSVTESKGRHLPNQTPQFSGTLEDVIVNPFWTVPKRIQRELERKAERDPEYYTKHNYQVVNGSLRQDPGAKNSLGRIKFQFPNDHDVYMHDTPDKKYFDRTVRAYSHGCMRVHNPYDFAAFLLARQDPSWNTAKVKSQAESNKQSRHKLIDPPAVHVEYYTVRVDDEGRTQFLTDIYELDDARIKQDFGLHFEKRPPLKVEKKKKGADPKKSKPAAEPKPEATDDGP